MESPSSTHSDPFGDPITSAQTTKEATLLVGRNASLTLGTDALIVLGTSLDTKVFYYIEGIRADVGQMRALRGARR